MADDATLSGLAPSTLARIEGLAARLGISPAELLAQAFPGGEDATSTVIAFEHLRGLPESTASTDQIVSIIREMREGREGDLFPTAQPAVQSYGFGEPEPSDDEG